MLYFLLSHIPPPPFPIFFGSSKCSFQSKSFYAFMKRIWHFTYFPLFRTSSLSLIKIPQLLQQLSYFINLLPLSTPFGGKDRCLNPDCRSGPSRGSSLQFHRPPPSLSTCNSRLRYYSRNAVPNTCCKKTEILRNPWLVKSLSFAAPVKQ